VSTCHFREEVVVEEEEEEEEEEVVNQTTEIGPQYLKREQCTLKSALQLVS
jgi:hypothetical protein